MIPEREIAAFVSVVKRERGHNLAVAARGWLSSAHRDDPRISCDENAVRRLVVEAERRIKEEYHAKQR